MRFSCQGSGMSESQWRRGKLMDQARSERSPLKAHRPDWRTKLRKNCMERLRKDRAHLLWKIRTSGKPAENEKEVVESALKSIVTDEMKKIKQLSSIAVLDHSKNNMDDILWEYDDPSVSNELIDGELGMLNEELLIEMDRIFHEELEAEPIQRELEDLERLYEEEDSYLAQAVYQQMQLNNDRVGRKVHNHRRVVSNLSKVEEKDPLWCPVCKRGQLKENHQFIYCTHCKLQLDIQSDKVNLEFLRVRLAEAHIEHLDRGCQETPRFCPEAKFTITALYLYCGACDAFEIVL